MPRREAFEIVWLIMQLAAYGLILVVSCITLLEVI